MHYLTVELMGGLGNQLFQIWTVLGQLAQQVQAQQHLQLAQQHLQLAQQNELIQPFFVVQEAIQCGHRKKTYWHTDLLKNLSLHFHTARPNHSPLQIIREPHFHYAPINLTQYPPGGSYKLLGYFQSYKYFEQNRATILKQLQLNVAQDNLLARLRTLSTTLSTTISLHFRIGDYAQKQNCHPLLPLQYYADALKLLQEKDPQCTQVLYFCEAADAALCAKKIQTLQQQNAHFTFVPAANTFLHEDWEQMLLMSLCKHHIIANSTFSWWGAYLSPFYKSGHTFYPSLWFGPALSAGNTTQDLCLPEWHSVPVP